ncbi:uncharacterized protein LOC122509507 [Leptopilina heterotoma]|uniref:uncharacterized protein LOC122509507 n=1 Tax=Leptopilina heterotoma TaxID=63436 RepID=UPI001CAA2EA2|nr:uncharacterized protein LOC122509507 [Leptopilina heterotoma]
MVNSWILKLLGIVLLFITGIFNYYKESVGEEKNVSTKYSDENTTPLFTISSETVPKVQTVSNKNLRLYEKENASLNNIQTNRKSFYDKDFIEYLNKTNKNFGTKNLQFISYLKSVILYFEGINQNDNCYAISNIDDFQIHESNLMKIINFIVENAINFHFYYNGYNFTISDESKKINEEKLKLMTSKCELPSKENGEIFLALSMFFKTYFKYFFAMHINPNYDDCYFDSLLSFEKIKILISHFDFKNANSSSRLSMYYDIISTLERLKLCIMSRPNVSLLKNDSVLEKVVISNFQVDPEFVIDKLNKKHELFMSNLEIVINYFKTVLNLNDCKEIQMHNKPKINKSNFGKIVELLTMTAMENYYLHKNYHFYSRRFYGNRSEEMKKLISSECEPNLNRNKATFAKLYEFFSFLKEYSKNFVDNKCYLKNILELNLIDDKIGDFLFKKNNFTRKSLINNIEKGIENVKHCSKL